MNLELGMTDDLTTDEKLISKKATFHKYCDVHLTFTDGNWENGNIEEVGSNYLILKLLKPEAVIRWGKERMPFFFMQIKDIEEYRGAVK